MPAKHVTGGVYVDGKPLTKSFKRQMGFVFQVCSCSNTSVMMIIVAVLVHAAVSIVIVALSTVVVVAAVVAV
jgi:hypothetical protein